MNNKKAIIIGLALLFFVGVTLITVNYIQNHKENNIDADKNQLIGEIKETKKEFAQLQKNYDSVQHIVVDLQKKLSLQKEDTVYIDKKFNDEKSAVVALPLDDKIKFLANRLPKESNTR